MDSSAGSFIQRIVDVRNYLTHFANPPHGGPPGARDLAEDAARMRRLLTTVLFQELGINGDAIAKAVGRIEPVPLHWIV